MEAPSLLQQHSYAGMHQQQPQAPGIYDQQQQQQDRGQQQPLSIMNNNHNNSSNNSNSTIGQKRDFSAVNGNSQDSQEGNFVKLFVGSVPRTISEEEVRPLFAEHGNVLEVALIKDRRTGQQQGCCFIKYATIDEAERAIRALNNATTLPGGSAPVQVRYADGERERLGAVEHKLFVGSLNKQSTEKEIQELFAPYGRVDDVYIMRDEQKQSRGCAFIKYPSREMATAAIMALNSVYVMPGCDQPLAVRFADPKRPKGGDTRVGGPGFGGPGFSPRPGNAGNRSAPAPMGQMGGRGLPIPWRPMGGPGMGPQPQMGPTAYGGSMGPRGPASGPTAMGGPLTGPGPMNGHPQGPMAVPSQMVGPGMLPAAQQQTYYQQTTQRQPQSYGQQVPSQQQPYGQLPTSQQQPQQQSSQQLLSLQSQSQPPLQQLPQGQATQQQHAQQLQSQQHAQQLQSQQHIQPQQQLQSQQQPQTILQSQSQQQSAQQQAQQQQLPLQQQAYYQVSALQAQQQPSWLLPVQAQTVSNLPPPAAAPVTCEWTEHTSPEGYKYYYNGSTGESKWEKPDELVAFEQQQQTTQIPQQSVTTPQYSGPAVISQHPIQALSYGQQPTNGSVDQPRQQGPPGANLFVFRIPDDFTDETLKETFAPFGTVLSARVGVERESGRNRGFGFVSYDNATSAESAIQGLNNVAIGGRRLKVERKRGEENGVQNFQPY